MANALVHEVRVDGCETVETVQQLIEALHSVTHRDDDLDVTYVVERLAEKLSDGSIAYSVRIRLAETV